MTAPIKISRRLVEEKPYLVWNAFIDLIVGSTYRQLTKKQRPAQLIFWYDSEVQNGGHLQFFENRGVKRVEDTIAALRLFGAPCQASVLARAVTRFESKPHSTIRSAEEYVATALEGEFDDIDRAYYKCRPETQDILERYVAAHQKEFVSIGEVSDRGFVERQAAMDDIGGSILKRMEKRRA